MIDIQDMKVLIVDDMIYMCRLLRKMMITIGYGGEFLYAQNGREALDILQKKPVDLVFLDYKLPDLSGGEVLRHIREDLELRDIPVIMITGNASTDYVAEMSESEIDDYIVKPLSINLLEEKVFKAIKKTNKLPPMDLHIKKARRFKDTGELDEAIKEVKRAIRLDPKSVKPVRELGHYYFIKDNLREAEKQLLTAVRMNPLDVRSFHYLGKLCLKLGDIRRASYYFERAMMINPRHLSRGIDFGKTLVRMKMIPKAIEIFNQAIDISRRDSETREEIANFCFEEGVIEYAVKLLASIVKEQPERKDLLIKLETAHEQLGDGKRAVSYY